MEEGDPPGLFMTLMMAARRGLFSSLARKRAIKLFTRHRTQWLGGLAPLVSTPAAVECSVKELDTHFASLFRQSRGRNMYDLFDSNWSDDDRQRPEFGWEVLWECGVPVRLRVEGGLSGKTAEVRSNASPSGQGVVICMVSSPPSVQASSARVLGKAVW
jgi:hypothetical protein